MTLTIALATSAGAPEPTRSSIADAFDMPDDVARPPTFELGRPASGATFLIRRMTDEEPIAHGDVDKQVQLTRWRIEIPLLRSPTSARDLIPGIVHGARALGASLIPIMQDDVQGGVHDDVSGPRAARRRLRAAIDARSDDAVLQLIDLWDAAHRAHTRHVTRLCDEEGSPRPPSMPRAQLERLHGWLLALADARDDPRRPLPAYIHGLDARDGSPARTAVRIPREAAHCRLPAAHFVLWDTVAGRDPEEPAAWRFDDVLPLTTRSEDGFYVLALDARLTEALATQASESLERFHFVAPVEIVDEESML